MNQRIDDEDDSEMKEASKTSVSPEELRRMQASGAADRVYKQLCDVEAIIRDIKDTLSRFNVAPEHAKWDSVTFHKRLKDLGLTRRLSEVVGVEIPDHD